jgi:integrase/recombinase XerD
MRLHDVVAEYVAYKRALGMRFDTDAEILGSFCRRMGDVLLLSITADQVRTFLDGGSPVSSYWKRKYTALAGRQVSLDAYVFRALLLLLYGACLRLGEALRLTMNDVDLAQALLCIQKTKFYKTRLVPLGRGLTMVLNQCVQQRNTIHCKESAAPFFCFRDGRPMSQSAARSAFRRLRVRSGVQRNDGARYQPRLHDLRHAAAVHRLVAWYRSGADLQRLLPQLATYLGHIDLSATQRYLTLTPELLREANLRFERYYKETSDD